MLQRLLVEEADAIVPSLATIQPLVASGLTGHLVRALGEAGARGELRSGTEVDMAADHAARLLLSYVGSSGRWDLTDPEEARRLVRDRMLAGVLG